MSKDLKSVQIGDRTSYLFSCERVLRVHGILREQLFSESNSTD